MAALPRDPLRNWHLPQKYDLKYDVKHILGAGRFCRVYAFHDTEQDELVAIKRFRGLFGDLNDCKRILRDIAILSELHHDIILRIRDYIIPCDLHSFDDLYIVMDITDSDLKQLLQADVFLEPIHVNTLLYNLLVGLRYLHSADMCHRNLKPDNCLVN